MAKKQKTNNLSLVIAFLLGALVVTTGTAIWSALNPPLAHTILIQAPAAASAAPPTTSPQTIERKVPIVAVNSDVTQGFVGSVDVQLIPGNGNIFVQTNPLSTPDLQDSANTAVQIAEQVTNMKLMNKDFVFNYNVQADIIGGGSGGAAETVATIAALDGKQINPTIAVSGTIESDGSIGPVGGLAEKSQAVAAAGYKTFLVPQGQSTVTEYRQATRQQDIGGFTYYSRTMVPQTVDLAKLNPGLKIVEVSTIQDVMKYMLQ